MLQPAGLLCWNFNLDSTESSGAILVQKLTEEVAIEFSHVILGPPSETPCDDVNDAILRGSQPRKAGRMTLLLPQQAAVLRLSEPLRIYKPPPREDISAHVKDA